MTPLFHIFIGLLIGIVASRLLNNWMLIPLCMFVSLVPDIIDKPLSFWYLEYNSGRTVAHTLLFAGIVTVIISLWNLMVAATVGVTIFVHGLLDSIWNLPTTWFYPFFGQFLIDSGLGEPGHWFWSIWNAELISPIEWISGIGIVLICWLLIVERRTGWQNRLLG